MGGVRKVLDGGADKGLMFWWGERIGGNSGCRQGHKEKEFLGGQGWHWRSWVGLEEELVLAEGAARTELLKGGRTRKM